MRIAIWLALLAFSGCIYDHRVTQAIMERRRRAREASGSHIGPTRAQAAVPPATRFSARVRFYVSDDYRRQHPQYRAALEDLVDESSTVLGPAFALRFESTEMREWQPQCDRDRLEACLDELARLDPGSTNTWVVGVLGDSPRFSSAFERLGVAHLVSSHLVLRDVADLSERKQIDDAFPTHTPGQRDEIFRHRKRHKRLAVFLHEWAHTLGGLHSAEAMDLLHSSYDDRMASFGDANASLIAVSLEARFEGDGRRLREYVARLDASRFVQGEQAQLLAYLQRPEPTPSAAIQTAPAEPGLLAADQETFRSAKSQADAGATRAAWAQLTPLVERYPSSYAVQHLACTLSMRVGAMSGAQAACPRVQQLAPK